MISVIVPIYNASKYMVKTIDQVLSQTMTDFELILIDDGSTDDSGEICDKYATQDSRVKAIHQANRGASSARNAGLEVATRELITFIDADDIVNDNYLECLISDYVQYPEVDLLIQGMVQKWHNREVCYSLCDAVYDMCSDEAARFFKNVYLNDFAGPYCKIFKRSILLNWRIRFSADIIYGEDFDFMLRYLAQCNVVATSSACNYQYVMHQDSVSSKIYAHRQELSGLRQLSDSFRLLTGKYSSVALNQMMIDSLIAYFWRVVISIYRYNMPRGERIGALGSFTDSELAFFRSNYNAETYFTRIVKSLLVRRSMATLDTVLNFRYHRL